MAGADEPDWSARRVAEDEALARVALPAWGVPADVPLRLVNLSENSTFLVDGPTPSYLRVGRPGYQSPSSVHSELAWAQALREQAGLCTPVPLPATDGRTVVDLAGPGGVRHLVRFAAVPGREPAPDALGEHAGRLGAIAATMHTHATGWCPPAGFTRFRWDLPAILGSKPRWGRWQDGIGVGRDEAHVLGRAADLVSDRLLDYGCGPDRFGLVHADMRLANLIVDGDRIAVIDFDDCGYSWFLFDLAATLSFVEDDPRVPSWCQDWLAGYARVRPLPPRADTLAATFVLLRRLMLLGWLASHAGIALSAELGAGFTVGSCELAERYLDAG